MTNIEWPEWTDEDYTRMERRSTEERAALGLSQQVGALLNGHPRDRGFAALIYALAHILATDLPVLAREDEKALVYRMGSVIKITSQNIRTDVGQTDPMLRGVNGSIRLWDLQWYADGRPMKDS